MQKKLANLTLLTISVIFSLFFCELIMAYLNYQKYKKNENIHAREWINLIKNKKLNHYISPKNYLMNSEILKKEKIFPLSQVSNTKILLCNEKFWVEIKTDKFGFNNSNNIWNNEINFVVIGDSFAMGLCVNREDNFNSNLMKISKVNGLNLGQGGFGPLLSYAAYQEYGDHLKAKNVIHFIFENDILDLENENNNKFLKDHYLSNKLQLLRYKQNEINKVIKNSSNSNADFIYKQRIKSYEKIYINIFKKMFKFGNLREKFNLVRKSSQSYSFDNIFNLVKKFNIDLKRKNINYYLVVITDPTKKNLVKKKELDKFILKLRNQNIKYLNTEESFKNQKIKDYWRGHYNEYGYKFLATKFFEKFNDIE